MAKMLERDKKLLLRVAGARESLFYHLVDHALSIAPAAALLGDQAPEHVLAAKALAELPDDADTLKPALRYLAALLAMPAECADLGSEMARLEVMVAAKSAPIPHQ